MLLFFFKQKTAYEMRSSDWSSDVCSSDLGEGQYSDDIRLEGQCHGVLVRSPFAHATIASIDLAEAKAAPGVLGVFTVDDLDADGVGTIPCLVPLRGKN